MAFIDLSSDQSSKEVFYDEVKCITVFDMEMADDVVGVSIRQNKLDVENMPATLPVSDTLAVSDTEYRRFLLDLELAMHEMQGWLNDVVFVDGVDLPFTINEIWGDVKFRQGSMHIFIEVEERAAQFFED